MKPNHILKRISLLFVLILGSNSVPGAQAIRDGQKVPKLKKVFVLSNGGPTKWHEALAKGT